MEDINIPGFICIVVFYMLILLVGIWATRKKRIDDKHSDVSKDERFILGGRNLGWVVGSCSMTASMIGGAQITSTVQTIYKDGLLATHAPWGYSLSLLIGGLLFAKKMRKAGYVTMLDPLHERYGKVMAAILSIPVLLGEVFWSAAIFGALGTTFNIVVGLHTDYVVIVSAVIAVTYTVFGGFYAVVLTDVVQLVCIFIGLWLVVPFAMTNDHVTRITRTTDEWIGTLSPESCGEKIDYVLLLIFGGIPWQVYFQRVLAAKSTRSAQLLTFSAAFGCLLMAIPGILLGAIARSTDWIAVIGNDTKYLDLTTGKLRDSQLTMPLVLQYLTPTWVSFIALAGISAAVMSSVDSSVLSASSMFSHNIYRLIRKRASSHELVWVMRITMFIVGVLATTMGLTLGMIFDLWVLSSDFVYVLLFPQLLCAVYIKSVNIYGSLPALVIGLVLRICGGVQVLGIPPLIEFPFYDSSAQRQIFPFRTFAMGCSLLVLTFGSYVANRYEDKYRTNMSQDEIDILKISYKEPEKEDITSFSKITRWSGSYNSITASALELRNKEDRLLLKTALGRNASACSNRPNIEVCDERLEM